MKKNLRTVNMQVGLYDSVAVDVMGDEVAIARFKVNGVELEFNMLIVSLEEAKELLRVLGEQL